jgi:transposase
LLIDSTIIKAHPHAAGARGGQVKQALGRSRGGFTTKVHAVTAEDGTLLRFVLTPGQVHDITEAKRLIPQRDGNRVVADRAYDCNAFIAHIEALGMTAVIPSRARRKVIRPLDRNAYRTRNVIERVFGRLKQARRVATRYDKTRASYSSFVAAASIVTVLSGWRA